MSFKKPKVQFYADECFPLSSVTHLRSHGYSIIHAFDLKLLGKPDSIHLKTSKKLKRVLLTLDRDFIYYREALGEKHSGVIILSLPSTTPEHVNVLCKKGLSKLTQEFMKDAVIKVTNSKLIKEKQGKIVFEKEL